MERGWKKERVGDGKGTCRGWKNITSQILCHKSDSRVLSMFTS